MDWSAQCPVVIPCHNAAGTIASVIEQCLRHLPTVIVIDDGSTDDTARLATRSGARVLRHDQPRGRGMALDLGWGTARQAGFTWAMTLDGDGQHAPDDIPRFLGHARESQARLIVGNRMAKPSQVPLLRRLASRWSSRKLSVAAGRKFPDALCSFRLVHLQSWSKVLLHSKTFEAESELLLAFSDAGHEVSSVPVQFLHGNGRSRIHPVRDSIRWCRWFRAYNRRRSKS